MLFRSNVPGRNIRTDMDRAGRQSDRLAMFAQRAGFRIDRQRGDMVVGLRLSDVSRGIVAGRDIQVAPRCVRPGVLHGARQCHGFTLYLSH